MKDILKYFLFVSIIFLSCSRPVFAQEEVGNPNTPPIVAVQDFQRAKVLKIIHQGNKEIYGAKRFVQNVEVEFTDGSDKGKKINVENGTTTKLTPEQIVKPGEEVVLYRGGITGHVSDFQIIEKYRLNTVLGIALIFFVLVLLISRWKGLGSLVGLAITFVVIMKYIVPSIISGTDPVLASIIGSSVIMLTSIYLAHGFSKKTSVAVFSTLLSLICTGVIAALFINITSLSGLGNEAASGLTFGTINLNFKGLLLGGIIIGTLGILDDVTTTQASTIFELAKANKNLTFFDLLKRGFNVGQEHISSVVNTLILAYTGASLPILLLILINPSQTPIWLILNNEPISEEIVRTIAGSMGLVLAVPITTITASYIASKLKNRE